MNEFKTIKFPNGGTVFDYSIDSETKQFIPWSESLGRFELDPDIPLQVSCTKIRFHFVLTVSYRLS